MDCSAILIFFRFMINPMIILINKLSKKDLIIPLIDLNNVLILIHTKMILQATEK